MEDLFYRLQGKDPLTGIYSGVKTFHGYNDLTKSLLSSSLVSYKENNMYLLIEWRLPGRETAWPSSARSVLQDLVMKGMFNQRKINFAVTSERVLPCLANFDYV